MTNWTRKNRQIIRLKTRAQPECRPIKERRSMSGSAGRRTARGQGKGDHHIHPDEERRAESGRQDEPLLWPGGVCWGLESGERRGFSGKVV
ncbi:hypothetical protein AOLI_G00163770 [Acnodon oligacanthus]